MFSTTMQTCFTCLKDCDQDGVSITNNDFDNISYIDKLCQCLQTKADELPCDDLLGKRICVECSKQLSAAYQFIEMIKKSFERHLQADVIQEVAEEVEIKTTIKCNLCEAEFEKRWMLHKHMKRAHSAEKKYICSYCGKAFKQSYHLNEHVTAHTGEKRYECTMCDKKFNRVSSQRRHIRSHEAAPGQKTKRSPFLCTICGKSFPYSNGVQRHMRTHLGIKTHECNVCHRKFNQSTHLHVHMRTHTGEKPYICHTCGSAFSLNFALQKHLLMHNEPAQDEKCKVFDNF